MRRQLRGLLVLAMAMATVSAGADPQLEQQLSATLKTIMPDAKITSVKPGPVAGLYEVMLGPMVLYMTPDAHFLVRGDIYDLKAKANLTDARRSAARVAAFSAQASHAIEFAPASGKPQHTLYVFTDMDCGYCRKMHQEIGKLTAAGIAVRYLAFPRTGLNSDSYNKAVSVWCSANPNEALTQAKLGQTVVSKPCDNPVAAQYHLGEAMGVHGTPAVFLDSGEELGGYIPAAELIRMFQTGEI